MALIGTIIVTPEKLQEKSGEMEKTIHSLREKFSEIKSLVDETASYWNGKAGDSLRKDYADINTEVEEVLGNLSEYPVNLMIMSGVYIRHDMNALQETEELPGDVL